MRTVWIANLAANSVPTLPGRGRAKAAFGRRSWRKARRCEASATELVGAKRRRASRGGVSAKTNQTFQISPHPASLRSATLPLQGRVGARGAYAETIEA